MIENPHSLQQGGSQYASMTNSASPAASVIPGTYLGVSSTAYNMGGGANNYRPGGGHQSRLSLEFVLQVLIASRFGVQAQSVLYDPTTAWSNEGMSR